MATESTTLELAARAPEGSRAARRLRREGQVPGILYGAGEDPKSFTVDARILRNALAHAHAVMEISLDGQKMPVMVKEIQRHPVRSDAMHVDFLRVRLDQTIQTTVTLHLSGGESAPGVKEGGILNQEVIHLHVEALPGDVPDAIEHDVSDLELNATVTVSELTAPSGVTLLDDPESVIATITPPTLEPVDEDIEVETQLVGDEAAADRQAAGDTAEEAQQSADASSE